MPILNYSTSISFEKTIAEISSCLAKHGATKIIQDFGQLNQNSNPVPTAITFHLQINGQTAAFALPAKYAGVLKAMQKDKKVPRNKCNEEQALRVSWRIVKDWVFAQMALTEAQLAEMAEVFLPYAVTKDGDTLYNKIKGNPSQFLLGE